MLIKEFLETNPNPIEPGYVFTLLPEKTKGIYDQCVKKAADSLGLRCESFLDFSHPGDALRDILASIQKAEILVYDITDLTPNVMWELGLALAIKDAERVIVIREETDTSLPFDIYSHRVTFQYDPRSEESLGKLYKTLRDEMQKINRASSRKAPITSPEVKSLLDVALESVESKKWTVAEALFQTMDAREPENWYIYNQWGIMHRGKGEFEAASPKFNQALRFTEFDEDKAFIYTELAVLHQMSRRYRDAEDWFRKAEKADSENTRLYIAWAEYHDELGDYFSAQAKINGALGKLKHKEDDPNFKELMLRHAYYDKKINIADYRKTFEQFRREEGCPVRREEGRPEPVVWEDSGNKLPYDIRWADLINNYTGKVVEGEISNITEHGIFVRLSREFTGLIFWRNLMEGYGEKFSKKQKVKVRISRLFVNPRDQGTKIDLRLVDELDEQSVIVQPKPVLLGVSAPQAARPGDSFAARFTAYIKGLEKDIEAQLIKLSPDSQIHLALKEARWRVGTKIKVRLSSPDLIVSSPEEEFIWRGEQEIIDFLVRVPPNVSDRNTVLQFDVLVGGIRIAKILLNLHIDSHANKAEPIFVTARPASTAFASFASKDHLRVRDRLSEIRRSGSFLDIFDQCLSLHPGEIWKPKLEREIKSRELFLLFWSANAKKSKWVQWEWKTALRERGITGIEPHPLDPISQAKPPRALKDLHFGDPDMVIRKAYEESP